MNEYNILILSAGRRVELIKCFQKAGLELGIKSIIVAGDCSDMAPAIYFANKRYKLPQIQNPDYIPIIIEICNKENIDLIIPTIDTDLLLLSTQKQYIELKTNAIVLVSSPEVIKTCRDKIRTHRFLKDCKFNMPRLYTDAEIERRAFEYPLFIKPRSGSSSINACKVNNEKELSMYLGIVNDPIVEDFIEGQEYTVDIFLDFEGSVITIVPRLRLATRDGEISKGKIIKDRIIINEIKKLMKQLKPIGHITVQLMKTDKGIEYIEINPRFGGGAPMSIQSGADSCKNLYRLLMGQKLTYNEDYIENITFLRFDNSICLDENLEVIK